MGLAHPCHLQVRAQLLGIVCPHVPGNAVRSGLVTHGDDAARRTGIERDKGFIESGKSSIGNTTPQTLYLMP